MKKRNIILTSVATVVIGTSIAFAGFKDHHSGFGHHKGQFTEHKMEKIIHKMDYHLDLTGQQEIMIKDIFEMNMPVLKETGKSRSLLRQEIVALDPASADFDQSVTELADKIADQARSRTLEIAGMVKQVSDVLTPAQISKAKELIEKASQYWKNHTHDHKDA